MHLINFIVDTHWALRVSLIWYMMDFSHSSQSISRLSGKTKQYLDPLRLPNENSVNRQDPPSHGVIRYIDYFRFIYFLASSFFTEIPNKHFCLVPKYAANNLTRFVLLATLSSFLFPSGRTKHIIGCLSYTDKYCIFLLFK